MDFFHGKFSLRKALSKFLTPKDLGESHHIFCWVFQWFFLRVSCCRPPFQFLSCFIFFRFTGFSQFFLNLHLFDQPSHGRLFWSSQFWSFLPAKMRVIKPSLRSRIENNLSKLYRKIPNKIRDVLIPRTLSNLSPNVSHWRPSRVPSWAAFGMSSRRFVRIGSVG